MPYTKGDNGALIFWQEQGSGEPLLLLPGLGLTYDMWYRLLPLLENDYRLIMLDNRGAGRSQGARPPYRIHSMAADAAAVLDAAGVEQAHVFGVSMGGLIAQELALSVPERVRGLVLGSTHCGSKNSVQTSEKVLSTIGKLTMASVHSFEIMEPYVYHPATGRKRIEEDNAVRLKHALRPDRYLAQLQACLDWEGGERLRQIGSPTLVLHGESDQLVPTDNAPLLAEAIPGAQAKIFPRASHLFFSEQPEETAREIGTFLESVGPTESAAASG